MKRWRLTYLMIGGSAILLVVFGLLQYGWLSQIAEADGDKARVRVREQANRFAMDFNREVQNAYFNFKNEADTFKNEDWHAFAQQYDYWRERATYPDLISEIYFLNAAPGSAALRFDRAARNFVVAELPPELSELRAGLRDGVKFTPLDEATLTLLLPIHESPSKIDHIRTRDGLAIERKLVPPERYGCLAIRLDPAVVKGQILPALNEKYFGESDFRASVVGSDGEAKFQGIDAGIPDASAPLFDLSPENFIFFGTRDLLSTIGGEKRERQSLIGSHVETQSFTRTETSNDRGSTVKIEVTGEPVARRSAYNATIGGPGPWTLQVQHAAGSVDAYVASTLRRNLAAGFGLLVLLAGAVAAVIVSAIRSKIFARRQIDFVSAVSHEFRTPLAVIYSAGENLADGVAKENTQVERYGALIKGEGRKLSSMVEQILEFAGARSGRRQFKFAATNVAGVVNAALQECEPLFDEKQFIVDTQIAEYLPPINADAGALSQAIQNLIANAVKYSNGDGWLRVAAQNGDGLIKISVEDRGIGISKSDLRQIFEPFYRSKEVVDAQINGNGLGLALVKQIVEAHGGRVVAESEVGKGSKFTIELPPN